MYHRAYFFIYQSFIVLKITGEKCMFFLSFKCPCECACTYSGSHALKDSRHLLNAQRCKPNAKHSHHTFSSLQHTPHTHTPRSKVIFVSSLQSRCMMCELLGHVADLQKVSMATAPPMLNPSLGAAGGTSF